MVSYVVKGDVSYLFNLHFLGVSFLLFTFLKEHRVKTLDVLVCNTPSLSSNVLWFLAMYVLRSVAFVSFLSSFDLLSFSTLNDLEHDDV